MVKRWPTTFRPSPQDHPWPLTWRWWTCCRRATALASNSEWPSVLGTGRWCLIGLWTRRQRTASFSAAPLSTRAGRFWCFKELLFCLNEWQNTLRSAVMLDLEIVQLFLTVHIRHRSFFLLLPCGKVLTRTTVTTKRPEEYVFLRHDAILRPFKTQWSVQ